MTSLQGKYELKDLSKTIFFRIAFSSIFEAYMNIKDRNQHELSLLEDDKLIYKTIFTILNKYKVS